MAKFESYALDPSFRPRATVNTAAKQSDYANKQIQQFEKFLNSNRVVDQQRIEDARFAGQNWKAIASLTESGAKYYEAVAKQEAKDKMTGEMWDTIFNPEFQSSDFETPFISEAERQNIIAKAEADGLEAEGDMIGSEIVRQRYQGLGQGINNERALAQSLKSKFPSELTAYVNSDKMVRYNGVAVPISTLYNSGDFDKVNFALNTAAVRVLEQNNAQFMTKDTLVKYLGETVTSTVGYMSTNQLTQTIAQQKDERLAETKAQGFNYGLQVTSANATQGFQELSAFLLADNNGIVTPQRANRVAAEVMLAGAASESEDQVRVVGKAEQVPGQPKTALMYSHPVQFAEAIQTARLNQAKNDKAFADNLINDTINSLKTVKDIDQKTAELEKAAKALEARGMYTEAQTLRANAGKYVVSPEAMNTYLSLETKQAQGEAVSDEQIARLLKEDKLSPELARKLRSQRKEVFAAGYDAAKVSKQINSTSFTAQIKNIIGGDYDPITGDWRSLAPNSPLDKNTLKTITTAYQKDLQTVLDQYATELPLDMPQSEKNAKMNERANKFLEEQTQKPTGKYYLGGLFVESGSDILNQDNQAFENVRNAGLQFGGTTLYSPPPLPTGGSDYSSRWNPGQGISQEIKTEYGPGDRLFSVQEAVKAKSFAEQSIFDRSTVQAAKELGLTPKQFLDQQISSWGLDPINWATALRLSGDRAALQDKPRGRDTADTFQDQNLPKSDPEQQDPGKMGFRLTAVTGIPTMLSNGFSVQAASILSAYLMLTSRHQNENLFDEDYVTIFQNSPIADKLTDGTLTYRTLAGLVAKSPDYKKTGLDAGQLINYAKTLEQLYGIQ